MRLVNIVLNIFSVILVGIGVALVITFLLPSSFFNPAPSKQVVATQKDLGPRELVPPALIKKMDKQEAAPKATKKGVRHKAKAAYKPKNNKLWLTIPKMARVKNSLVPTAISSDEEAMNVHTAIHVKGTGFPWQKQANVYIAGHRIGYLNTPSLLAFYDLNKLGAGDKIRVKDANGRHYTYKVFRTLVVTPSDIAITRPIKGRNILSLQSCTLPDYTHRLIIQAVLVG
ncbi:MAG: class E sortase [Rubrobacteraceae bacterium]